MLPLLPIACGPPPSERPPASPVPTSSTAAEPAIVDGPTLGAVDPALPLVRKLTLSTSLPCAVGATWSDGTRTRSVSSPVGTEHVLALVGLRAGATTAVEVSLADRVAATVEIVTDPLPPSLPALTVHVADPARMEPGDTIVGIATDFGEHYTLVLDPTGAVIWLRRDATRMLEVRVRPDRTLLGLYEAPDEIVELDLAGEVLRRWAAEGGDGEGVAVAVPSFHHEVARLANGDLLTLANHRVPVAGFPASYTDPALVADAEVLADRVVSFRDDGAVVHDHDLSGVLDLRRIGFYSLWDVDGAYDWSHSNSAAEDPADGDFVVSVRHQDAIVELDRESGELEWILANPDGWPPELDALRLVPIGEPFEWPWHAHAAVPGEDGRLLLFDNGNERRSPLTGAPATPISEMWSRVVEYRVDEDARTVEQLWQFELPGQRTWSSAEGNAERLPTTGNVLSLWGFVTHVDGEYLGGANRQRIVEFVPETGEVLYDVELTSDPEGSRWNGYRAHRIPPL